MTRAKPLQTDNDAKADVNPKDVIASNSARPCVFGFTRREILFGYILFVLPVLTIGYTIVVAIADHQGWWILNAWQQLCAPVVEVLRGLVPVFDETERALGALNLGYRTPLIEHVLAIEWLIFVPSVVVALWAASIVSSETCAKHVITVPDPGWRRFLAFLTGPLLVALPIYFIVFRLPVLTVPIYAWQKSNAALPTIGVLFFAPVFFSCGLIIVLRALFFVRSQKNRSLSKVS